MNASLVARGGRRRIGLLVTLCAANAFVGCAGASANRTDTPSTASPAPRAAPPDVVVAIVVDQFAAWIADSRVPTFPADGGFARLRREGTWTHRAEHPYAATDTAPGHAMIFTGRPPRESGIYANETLDARGNRISILRDEQTHLVDHTGPLEDVGSSINLLRVPTIADDLRAQRPNAVIVSVSLKDRGAIFGGGRHPDATIWFDPGGERLATSTAYATHLPDWAIPLGTPDAIRARRTAPWEPFDAAWVASHAATPDAQRGEGDLDGWGTTFPHDFTRARRPGSALRASPRGDELVLAVATAAVEHARRPGEPMFMAVSLSSHDYVNHLFGPDSWEAWDHLRRLDAALAHFFADLDRLVGAEHWAVVLTADHGGITLPEAAAAVPGCRPWCGASRAPGADPYERPCAEMTRLIDDALTDDLRTASTEAIGPGRWVLGVADPYVFLTPEGNALTGARRTQLLTALRARLEHTTGVRAVYDASAIPTQCPEDGVDSIDALVCRSIPTGVGPFYILPQPGAFFDANYTIGFGTSHGSPYRYDRTIPMFVRAPGYVEPNRSVDTPVDSRAVHDTLARLLGVR